MVSRFPDRRTDRRTEAIALHAALMRSAIIFFQNIARRHGALRPTGALNTPVGYDNLQVPLVQSQYAVHCSAGRRCRPTPP